MTPQATACRKWRAKVREDPLWLQRQAIKDRMRSIRRQLEMLEARQRKLETELLEEAREVQDLDRQWFERKWSDRLQQERLEGYFQAWNMRAEQRKTYVEIAQQMGTSATRARIMANWYGRHILNMQTKELHRKIRFRQ